MPPLPLLFFTLLLTPSLTHSSSTPCNLPRISLPLLSTHTLTHSHTPVLIEGALTRVSEWGSDAVWQYVLQQYGDVLLPTGAVSALALDVVQGTCE